MKKLLFILSLFTIHVSLFGQGCAENTDSLAAYSFPYVQGTNCTQRLQTTQGQAAIVYYERELAAGAFPATGCPGNSDSLAAYSFPFVPGTNCTQRVSTTPAEAAMVYFLRLLNGGGGGGGGPFWKLTGNPGTTPGTNFIGTTDGHGLELKVNNAEAGWLDYTSPYGAYFGYGAGNYPTSTGLSNTAMGYYAGTSNTTGADNAFFGTDAGRDNMTGTQNVGVGVDVLYNNRAGIQNTALGFDAMANTTGSYNTAIGSNALSTNVTGSFITAVGWDAGINDTNSHNVFVGDSAGSNCKSGSGIVDIGSEAGERDTSGVHCTNVGQRAGHDNTTGSSITAVGYNALLHGKGSKNTALGDSAGYSITTGTNDIAIGYQANISATASNTIQLGNSAITALGIGTGSLATSNLAPNLHIDSHGKVTASSDTTGSGSGWLLTGNAGTVDGTNFIGTTDNVPFNIRVDNKPSGRLDLINNTIWGYEAGYISSLTGANNTDVGGSSMIQVTSGSGNTAVGSASQVTNITGTNNTTIGYGADVTSSALTNATSLGYNAIAPASNSIQLGNSSVTKMYTGNGSLASTNFAPNTHYNTSTGQWTVTTDTALYNNVNTFGAVSNNIADSTINTTAIQSAINAANLNGRAVYFPDTGTYWIGGAFSSIGGTGSGATHTCYAILKIPNDTNLGDARTITFMAPNVGQGYTTRYHRGTYLRLYKSHSTDGNHCILGTSYNSHYAYGFSFVNVNIINLNFATRWDAGVNCVDLYWASQASNINNVKTEGDTTIAGDAIPTHQCYGLILPGWENNVNVHVYNYSSNYMWAGVYASEHALLEYVSCYKEYAGIVVQNAQNGVTILHPDMYTMTMGVYAPTTCAVAGATVQKSYVICTGGDFGTSITYSLSDSGGNMYGTAMFNGTSGGAYYPTGGPAHMGIINSGATLDYSIPSFTPGVSQYEIPWFNNSNGALLTDLYIIRQRGGSYNATYGCLQLGTNSFNTQLQQSGMLFNIAGSNANGITMDLANTSTSSTSFTGMSFGDNSHYGVLYYLNGSYTNAGINSPFNPNSFSIYNTAAASTSAGIVAWNVHANPFKVGINGTLKLQVNNNGLLLVGGQLYSNGAGAQVQDSGDLALTKAGSALRVHSGTAGDFYGDATLSSGTIAITITGMVSTDRAFVQLTSVSGTLGAAYTAVCTTNTLTIKSVTTSGSTNTADNSTVTYAVLRKP